MNGTASVWNRLRKVRFRCKSFPCNAFLQICRIKVIRLRNRRGKKCSRTQNPGKIVVSDTSHRSISAEGLSTFSPRLGLYHGEYDRSALASHGHDQAGSPQSPTIGESSRIYISVTLDAIILGYTWRDEGLPTRDSKRTLSHAKHVSNRRLGHGDLCAGFNRLSRRGAQQQE